MMMMMMLMMVLSMLSLNSERALRRAVYSVKRAYKPMNS